LCGRVSPGCERGCALALFEAVEEFDQQAIHFVGTFLLSPMADAREDYLPGEVRDMLFEGLDFLAPEAEDAITIAGDEEGGLVQLGAVEERS
jgi:hypothetical protein